MLEDLQQLYEEILLEYRTSIHLFSDSNLIQAYKDSYKIFIDLGFTTASTFAIWDFIYRLLPDTIKTPEVQQSKMKHFGTKLRPFVVALVNNNIRKIDLDDLTSKMLNKELVKQYLEKSDQGNRRRGKLNKLSKEAGRRIERDY